MRLTKPSIEKILALHKEFGSEVGFSRLDLKDMFGIQSAAAGDLINKMKDLNLIEPVHGQGKGKYRFIR